MKDLHELNKNKRRYMVLFKRFEDNTLTRNEIIELKELKAKLIRDGFNPKGRYLFDTLGVRRYHVVK